MRKRNNCVLVVVTLQDSSAKGDPGKEEESDPDLLRKGSSKELKVEEETTGMEHQMMKLTLGITGTGKGGEDYSIPLNVSRPRSGSGSRYLTDRVRIYVVFLLVMKFNNGGFWSHQFLYMTSKWSKKI